jgi:hypothetical protein
MTTKVMISVDISNVGNVHKIRVMMIAYYVALPTVFQQTSLLIKGATGGITS